MPDAVPWECGDRTCTGPETPVTCPFDCAPPVCGDGNCEDFKGETAASCRDDCHACGNDVCESPYESAADCPKDCHVCGNNVCERPYEDALSCYADCHCGDHLCLFPENFGNCPIDCTMPI